LPVATQADTAEAGDVVPVTETVVPAMSKGFSVALEREPVETNNVVPPVKRNPSIAPVES
jgi:hypothetical protein